MDRALEMQVFCMVVDRGSFVAAAEPLGISKAGVSRHVNMLEQRLGARLLHRTTRRLALTEEGKMFYQQARDVLNRMEDAENSVSRNVVEPVGTLRVNAPFSFGILHLAPRWSRFLRQYPKIELDLSLNDRVVDLVEEGFDIAVRIANLADSSMVGRRIASTRMRLCAAPSYLRSSPPITEPADLVSHRIIAYSHFMSGNEWRYIGPNGEGTVSTRPIVRSNNGDTCRTIALAGEGILLHPSFMVGDDIRSGDLVELIPHYRFVELGVYIIYPTRKYISPKVQAIINFLVEEFSAIGWDE